MLIQLVLGIMNLAVMVTVAAVIAFEKLWRSGPVLAHVVGVLSIARWARPHPPLSLVSVDETPPTTTPANCLSQIHAYTGAVEMRI